ncbi:MAG: TM0106 family RecB-like putative nuclease [Candidatus Atribacteria bacterium]|nr:TM0106 family RecB-like putative nuclease [Candidatus Atribacteria bacterium]
MELKISANMLYNYVQCPHRLYLDQFEDPVMRDPETAFTKLLWENGIDYEKKVVSDMKKPFLDLSRYMGIEKETRTRKAMNEGIPIIYGGRISTDLLVGEPDLLVKNDHEYLPGDIKSGSGLEGESESSEGKPKLHYAIQMALYVDILQKLHYAKSRKSFIYDIHGRTIMYDLDNSKGRKSQLTWWEVYQNSLETVQKILGQEMITNPSHGGSCKLCHWKSYCIKQLILLKDLTLIPELGRKKRETMVEQVNNLLFFAKKPLSEFISGKKTVFAGISIPTLEKYHARAKLLAKIDKVPYAKTRIKLPQTDTELFFDIETDPMHDFCYLHGFVERHHADSSTEKYVPFFVNNLNEKEEERIFIDAWHYIKQHFPCTVYYYSPYEKIIWKKLARKYPEIITSSELESFFNSPLVVDLYTDIVKKHTEWPTFSYSVKDLAKFLGFQWRDKSPSGAESIEWYHRWLENKNPEIKDRILQYNEDDCIAMRVLLEGIKKLPLKTIK